MCLAGLGLWREMSFTHRAIRHIATLGPCGILLGFYSRMQMGRSDKVIFFCLGPGGVDVI